MEKSKISANSDQCNESVIIHTCNNTFSVELLNDDMAEKDCQDSYRARLVNDVVDADDVNNDIIDPDDTHDDYIDTCDVNDDVIDISDKNDDVIDTGDGSNLMNENDDPEKLYNEVRLIRNKHVNNVIISHLNVNSLGPKINEIKELVLSSKVDVLVLSETKLDGSYKQDVLDIDGYCCIRKDKRSNSGGLLAYISKDIPLSEGSISICNNEIECMSIELNIGDDKLMLLGMYKNPKMDPVLFKKTFNEICEKMCDSYENIIVIGDLNFNMMKENMLSHIIPAFSLENIIKEATCFKSSQASIIDVMLVTKRRKFIQTFSVNTGISDFHNLIGGVLRLHKPAPRIKKISVRKLSKIDYEQLKKDITQMDLTNSIDSCNDVNSAYDLMHEKLCAMLDKYAPKKQKIIKKNDFHCMSKELRKEILYRNRLRNKYYKFRSNHYLMLYRSQRNKVNAIKRKEISKYFHEKCQSGTRNKDFWKAIKPLFSKSRTKSDSIPLREKGEIVTDEQKVCGIFNGFFQSIGSDIGLPENNDKPLHDIIDHYQEHPSVKCIKENTSSPNSSRFFFRFVSEREIMKYIKQLSVKKAAGYDEIPAIFVKKIGMQLAKPLTQLMNRCILENTFPSKMKMANITPLYKKKDKLNKDNYRSVNLLPILSKIMERALFDQIYEFINPKFHSYLSGFRKGYSCQDVLLRMTEDIRQSLDRGFTLGIIAIDLSKAFDCMPHGLLLAKLSAYGFDIDSCHLMQSYLMNRLQRVKIGETFSDWVNNIKGVPQGSILGPLLFNIFINDFLFVKLNSKTYNYADDNTLISKENDIDTLNDKLRQDCIITMEWFKHNNMKANASKFQLMYVSRSNEFNDNAIVVEDTKLQPLKSINILGMELDQHLKFITHVDEICHQTGKQINALKRIKHHLENDSKLTIYNSYMNCNFNYCSVIWMFANKSTLDKIERTNKRALRFVTNKSHLSYNEICKKEKQLSIYKKCIKNMAIQMYKVKRGTAPDYISELFRSHNSGYEMRDNSRLVLPAFNTVRYGKNSFSYLGAKIWNSIPVTIKNSVSLSTYKSALTGWLLTCDENDLR